MDGECNPVAWLEEIEKQITMKIMYLEPGAVRNLQACRENSEKSLKKIKTSKKKKGISFFLSNNTIRDTFKAHNPMEVGGRSSG